MPTAQLKEGKTKTEREKEREKEKGGEKLSKLICKTIGNTISQMCFVWVTMVFLKEEEEKLLLRPIKDLDNWVRSTFATIMN